MQSIAANCPCCGAELKGVRINQNVKCEYCNSTIAIFNRGVSINIIDISDKPEMIDMICIELIRMRRYDLLGRYAKLLYPYRNYIIRGRYYTYLSTIMNSHQSEKIDSIIKDSCSYEMRQRILDEVPVVATYSYYMANKNNTVCSQFPSMIDLTFELESYFDGRPVKFTLISGILNTVDAIVDKNYTLTGYHALSELLHNTSLLMVYELTDYHELYEVHHKMKDISDKIVANVPYHGTNLGISKENQWEDVKNFSIFQTKFVEEFDRQAAKYTEDQLNFVSSYWNDKEKLPWEKGYISTLFMAMMASFYETNFFSRIFMIRMKSKIRKTVKNYFKAVKYQ